VTKQVQKLDHVIIRFAGDSGDGMQLAGDRFTQETAVFGNDLSTMPNFPAEIRAPAGTLAGVSSFQLQFADHDILTPGDAPDVLIAMNPAALQANIKDLPRGGDLIINTDEFTKRNLTKVGYAASPLEDASLEQYNVHAVPITSMTVKALGAFDITRKDAERAKNMFALGMLSWLYDRPADGTLGFLKAKFASKPEIPGGLELRRDHGGLLGQVRGQARAADARHLPEHHRQHGPGLRPHRRLAAGRPAALPRLLSDHAGLGHLA
jgi:2-oxoglutarate ferredoxin oxidoreductase subunit alpha